MNCLRCGGEVKGGNKRDSMWQWMCYEDGCNFRWDSEHHSIMGDCVMTYFDDRKNFIGFVPFGCLGIFGEEL